MGYTVWGGALIGVLMVTVLTGCGLGAPRQQESLQHGPFEIVASGRRISSGAFPNNSGNPFATTEVTDFRVRWQGRDVVVPSLGAHFWRVLRLMDAPRPALLVGNTDLHLVYEDQGRLVVRELGGSGFAEVQWLDQVQGQPGETAVYGVQKVAVDQGTELRGGRWLRLSNATVLDVQTLATYPVRPWVTEGLPLSGLSAGSDARASAFSPGRSQYVAIASDYVAAGRTERYEALLVVDIPTGNAYGLKLDPSRMRYHDAYQLGPDWIAHYFRWTRDTRGVERLVERTDAAPLAWKGHYVRFGENVEYRVAPVRAEMAATFAAFLTERMGAKPAADALGTGRSYTVPGCDHLVAISAITETEREIGVYVPSPSTPPWVRCQDVVRRIGEAFDAELATGRHDALFVMTSATRP